MTSPPRPEVEIVEIIRRSEQGITRPFICRADDGNLYFVKGRGAGVRSLIAEWTCGRLAQALGLPCAAFAVAHVPEELAAPGLVPEFSDLGAGPAFGSLALSHVQEINLSHLADVDEALQADVLVFDWWIRNSDRTLTGQGGNPNLLWDQDRGSLVVIDHNQAFDPAFDPQAFLDLHVFSGVAGRISRAGYQSRLEAALDVFESACEGVPPQWWWFAEDVPADFDRREIGGLLARCREAGFWELAR
jgi:hypothetical protein